MADTITNNVLIAEFMGAKTEIMDESVAMIFPNGKAIKAKYLRYHKSFSDLMEVVKRIELHGYNVSISGETCDVNTTTGSYSYSLKGLSKLESVYFSSIRAIKHLSNRNTKPKTLRVEPSIESEYQKTEIKKLLIDPSLTKPAKGWVLENMEQKEVIDRFQTMNPDAKECLWEIVQDPKLSLNFLIYLKEEKKRGRA